jgi:hypothetical protein
MSERLPRQGISALNWGTTNIYSGRRFVRFADPCTFLFISDPQEWRRLTVEDPGDLDRFRSKREAHHEPETPQI